MNNKVTATTAMIRTIRPKRPPTNITVLLIPPVGAMAPD
jgi:hypothetical protein